MMQDIILNEEDFYNIVQVKTTMDILIVNVVRITHRTSIIQYYIGIIMFLYFHLPINSENMIVLLFFSFFCVSDAQYVLLC